MKKAAAVAILGCVFCALVLSCGTSGSAAAPASTTAAASSAVGDLGAFRARMEDNFQWGTTYQAIIANPRMLNGHQIAAGETYTLKVTFTTSRDLEDKIQIIMVDTTERGNWWTELTINDESTQLPTPRQDQEISATITFKTVADSTGTSGAANSIVFMTDGEGVTGRAGSGVQKPFDISFSEFVLTKVE